MESEFAKLNHWKKIPSRLQPLPLDPRKCAALNPKFPKQMHAAQANNTKAAGAEGCTGGGAAGPGLAPIPLRDQPRAVAGPQEGPGKNLAGSDSVVK